MFGTGGLRVAGALVFNFLWLVTGGRIRIHAGTAAQLLALTEKRVQAGDAGIVVDQGFKWVEAQTPGPASTTWAQRATDPIVIAQSPADATKRYMDFVTGSPAAAIGYNQRYLLKWAGEVRSVTLIQANDPGSTIVGTHLDMSTTATETDTQDPGAVDTAQEYAFTATTFTAGQRLSISCDPTDAPGFTACVIVVEYLIPLVAA